MQNKPSSASLPRRTARLYTLRPRPIEPTPPGPLLDLRPRALLPFRKHLQPRLQPQPQPQPSTAAPSPPTPSPPPPDLVHLRTPDPPTTPSLPQRVSLTQNPSLLPSLSPPTPPHFYPRILASPAQRATPPSTLSQPTRPSPLLPPYLPPPNASLPPSTSTLPFSPPIPLALPPSPLPTRTSPLPQTLSPLDLGRTPVLPT